MSEPQPGYHIPSEQHPPKKSGIPGWAIALIAILGSLLVVCIVGAVLVVMILGTLGGQVEEVFNEIDSSLSEADSAQTAIPVAISSAQGIGEQITSAPFRFVVTGANVANSSETLAPSEGMVYYQVQIEVQNTTSEPAFVSAFDTHIQDSQDQVFSLSVLGLSSIGASTDQLFTSIEGNATTTLTLVYEVPSETSELFWVYSGGESPVVVQTK